MNELRETAADLRVARTNLAERIERAPLSEDARQVIQEHLYALERISDRLDRLECDARPGSRAVRWYGVPRAEVPRTSCPGLHLLRLRPKVQPIRGRE
jgi:hypothetical protein